MLWTVYKTLTSIFYVKLIPYAEEIRGEYQGGFWRVRSTIDQIGKYFSSEFKVNKILRQGDVIVPLLFNIVWEIAIRRSEVETGGSVFEKCSQIMAYADVFIMGRRLRVVEEVFTSLVEERNTTGLEMKEKKTNLC